MMQFISLFYSFRRRLDRKRFWLVLSANSAALFIVSFLSKWMSQGTYQERVIARAVSGDHLSGLIENILGVVLVALILSWIVSVFSIYARRLRDIDRSAWWIIFYLALPLELFGNSMHDVNFFVRLAALAIAVWGVVELGIVRGSKGTNRFGPDPLEASVQAVTGKTPENNEVDAASAPGNSATSVT
jgi:uncharacterized membrane protein YhaH (DUF805 family)